MQSLMAFASTGKLYLCSLIIATCTYVYWLYWNVLFHMLKFEFKYELLVMHKTQEQQNILCDNDRRSVQ